MEDFVSFELAEKLKENGFNKYSIKAYTKIGVFDNTETYKATNEFYCYAPTISQVLKWLREEKKIYLELVILVDGKYMCDIYKIDARPIECLGSTEYSKTYEAAALAGIEYVLDNLI